MILGAVFCCEDLKMNELLSFKHNVKFLFQYKNGTIYKIQINLLNKL
jgi:hypothetical protein